MSDRPEEAVAKGARISRVMAAIALALEIPEAADVRLSQVLTLAREIIPYDRCALLRVSLEFGSSLIVRPPMDENARRNLEERVNQLWLRVIAADVIREAPIEHTVRMALPIVDGDTPAGILLFEREAGHYDANHLRITSSLAAQIGGFQGQLSARQRITRLWA